MTRFITFMLVALALGSAAKAEPTRKADQWRADLEAYQSGLEKGHIDLYHTSSREDFSLKIRELKDRLTTLSDPQIEAALMQITHSIGDGHTAMPLWGSKQPRFPIQVRWIEGQAVITAISANHADLLGAVIERWNGRTMGEIYERLSPYVPFVENEGSQAVRVAQYMTYAALGRAIGINDSARMVSLELLVGGAPKTLDLQALAQEAARSSSMVRLDYRRDLATQPSYLETTGLQFALLTGKQTGYIQFDSYPGQEDMLQFAASVSQAMEAAQARNLVIDFRENFGGDFFIGLLLAAHLNALDTIDWKEGVYVLIGPKTFSAAMSNAAQFSEILNARLVGQPSGANPCSYQDMGSFNLPNSRHVITYSKRRYCFAKPVRGALAPDIHVPMTSKALIAGEDPAFDWIMRDITQRMSRLSGVSKP